MKKVAFFICVLLMISVFPNSKIIYADSPVTENFFSCIPSTTGEPTYVFTPNNSQVNATHYYPDLAWNTKLSNKALCEDLFPDAIFISESTNRYNCHSYAWHSQDFETNTYWIHDPTQYYTDGSYLEVLVPQVGDIICYFDGKGTSVVEDDVNLHSGIVVAVAQGESNDVCGIANLVTVESKWGECPLFRHRGDVCPYTACENITSIYPNNDYADYVKFYRRHTNHVYDNYINNDNSSHKAYCECGAYINESHDYHYSYVSRTQCKGVCEYCNYQIITTHNINLLTKVCRQCFARFSNDGVEVPINNLPPDIVCTKNHQHNSSCVIVARE